MKGDNIGQAAFGLMLVIIALSYLVTAVVPIFTSSSCPQTHTSATQGKAP